MATIHLPRCSKHEDRAELPRLCHTCQRIAVEHDIVTRTVNALLGAGFYLRTDASDDEVLPTTDKAVIMRELLQVDDERLMVFAQPDDVDPFAWVYFVYGNYGWDVVSDYTMNLEDVLAPTLAYAETLS